MGTIMDALWNSNDNLMQIMAEDRYTFFEELETIRKDYYSNHPKTVDALLDSLYVSSAVKRPIYRTVSILSDIKKACGGSPDKSFCGNGTGRRRKRKKDEIQERSDH